MTTNYSTDQGVLSFRSRSTMDGPRRANKHAGPAEMVRCIVIGEAG
jgi:hypothetical protein